MPIRDFDERRAYDRAWRKANPEIQRNYFRKIRRDVVAFLGGKCVYCGCTIFEALEINHKKGGGRKEAGKPNPRTGKKYSDRQFYLDILKGRRSRRDLEIACSPCNAVHRLKLKGITGFKVTWKPMRLAAK